MRDFLTYQAYFELKLNRRTKEEYYAAKQISVLRTFFSQFTNDPTFFSSEDSFIEFVMDRQPITNSQSIDSPSASNVPAQQPQPTQHQWTPEELSAFARAKHGLSVAEGAWRVE